MTLYDPKYRLQFEQGELPNGLRFVFAPDDGAPVAASVLLYDVGARNEDPGKTGFAHLFEHMMFQGSANVPREMHFKHVEANGGVCNAFTSFDVTVYFELMPSSKLPLALWLEADRMQSLDLSQQNLDNQRAVVKEERRLAVDNKPYAPARERLREIAYDSFANQHSIIGSMEDIDRASLSEFQEFFRTYYAPNNALLVVAGSFDPRDALKLIEELFGGASRRPDPRPPDVNEPNRSAERRETIHDPLANVPGLAVAWKAPDRAHPDAETLSMAAEILFGGSASRIYQRLVKKDALAVSVSGYLEMRRGPSLFHFFALHRPDVDPTNIERAVYDEFADFALNGPNDQEVERARARVLAQRLGGLSIYGLQSPLGKALALGEAGLFDGDPDQANLRLDRALTLTPSSMKEAVARWLIDDGERATLHIGAGEGGS